MADKRYIWLVSNMNAESISLFCKSVSVQVISFFKPNQLCSCLNALFTLYYTGTSIYILHAEL